MTSTTRTIMIIDLKIQLLFRAIMILLPLLMTIQFSNATTTTRTTTTTTSQTTTIATTRTRYRRNQLGSTHYGDSGQYTVDPPYNYNYNDNYGQYTTSTNTGTSFFNVLSILFNLLIIIGCCCICCRCLNSNNPGQQQQQQQQQQTTTSGRTENQLWRNNTPAQPITLTTTTTTTTGPLPFGTNTNQDQHENNDTKSFLTEDDFMTLPQFTYHIRNKEKSQQQLPSVETATPVDDNNNNNQDEAVVVVMPINATIKSADKIDDPVPDDIDKMRLEDDVIDNTEDTTEDDSDFGDDKLQNQNNICILTDEIKNKIQKTLSTRSNIVWNENSSSYIRNDCCCICLEEFQENEILTALPRCIHLFHTNCIKEWIVELKSESCPLCKTIILDKGALSC